MTGKDFYTLMEISEICRIKTGFIKELAKSGVIEIRKRKNTECAGPEIIDIVKIAGRLYFDLGVNIEGIEIILSMRNQILDLQEEVTGLRKRVNQLTNEQKYRNLEIINDQGLLFDV